MKITKKNINDSQIKYTITIDGKEWQSFLKKGLEKITQNIKVPGFRKGKVPLDVVKGKVSDEEIIQESAKGASDAAFKYLVDTENPKMIMQPIMDIGDITDQKAQLHFTVQKLPVIKLDKYSGFGIKKDEVKVAKEDVEKEVEALLRRFNTTKPKKGAAKKGDVVKMNFEGFVDNKPFKGGKSEAFPLELGSNRFIPGFEDQLEGVKVGDNKDVVVTFPKDYHSKEVAGKKATFKCQILEISTLEKPKLTDSWIKSQKFPEVNDVKSFKARIKNVIAQQKETQATRAHEEKIIARLIKDASFDVPPRFLELETNALIAQFEKQLKTQGMDIPKFKEMSGQSDEQIAKNFASQAERRVRVSLIFEHIAEKEKIDVSQEEVDKAVKEIAKSQQKEEKEVKKDVGRIAYNIRIGKIFDIIKK